MVAVDSYQKLTRLLELYLLKQSGNSLPIQGYSLIALMPIDPNSWVDRQSLLVSSPAFSSKSRREVIRGLFVLLQQGLPQEQYLEIYNIDLWDVDSSPVQRINAWDSQRTDNIFSVPINVIGGVTSQAITVIRSSLLEMLVYHTPLRLELINHTTLSGRLLDIHYLEADARLIFETDAGSQECYFTDIIKISS